MTVTLLAGFGTTAAAVADGGTVTVSITYGDFDTDGNYTGGGFANTNFYIEDYVLDIDDIQEWIDYAALKETYYLPDSTPDPLNGEASVLDAIILAFLYNGFEDIDSGWDSAPVAGDPGGYVSNVYPQALITNPSVDFEGENGNLWTNYSGTGWNTAYGYGNALAKADEYASNIELSDGMVIVFDVSPYSINWDSGEPWPDDNL